MFVSDNSKLLPIKMNSVLRNVFFQELSALVKAALNSNEMKKDIYAANM
jgi:hypothetical protein